VKRSDRVETKEDKTWGRGSKQGKTTHHGNVMANGQMDWSTSILIKDVNRWRHGYAREPR